MRKLTTLLMAVAVIGTTFSLSACQKSDDVIPTTNANTTVTLSDAEQKTVIHMREEEKMARDVYDEFLAQYPTLTFFSNISGSEQKHMDAVLILLNTYNLTDPVGTNAPGVFTSAEIQTLYNTLLTKGQAGELDAITVGMTIEDMDIYDLQLAIDEATQQDMINTYSNLLNASKNHMREFYAQLKARGVTYTPQYITQALYNEIVSTPKQHGNGH